MTAANPTSQPEPRLSMTAITIELQGVTLVSTEEDVSRISWYTGARQIRFTREADGSIEAILGNSRLNIAPNRTKLTRGLRSHPALAGNDIRECCHMMTRILEGAQDTVEMLVIRLLATAAVRPELGRSIRGTELRSRALEPATSPGGVRFPIWHHLTPNDASAGDPFRFSVQYDTTAAVIIECNPSEAVMVDIALALMDEMDRRTTLAMADEDEEPKQLAEVADPAYFGNIIRSFPEWEYDTRAIALFVVVDSLAVGHLTVPDGALQLTMGELRQLARGYEDLFTGHPDAPQGPENLDQRSIGLLRQIRSHNWPSEDDATEAK